MCATALATSSVGVSLGFRFAGALGGASDFHIAATALKCRNSSQRGNAQKCEQAEMAGRLSQKLMFYIPVGDSSKKSPWRSSPMPRDESQASHGHQTQEDFIVTRQHIVYGIHRVCVASPWITGYGPWVSMVLLTKIVGKC